MLPFTFSWWHLGRLTVVGLLLVCLSDPASAEPWVRGTPVPTYAESETFTFAPLDSGSEETHNSLEAEGNAGTYPAVTPSFAGVSLHGQLTDLSQSAWPPSPGVAVGPTHLVTLQNQSVAIFNRSGSRVSHVRLRDFLNITVSGIRYSASFDPRILFDPRSGRWIAACVASGAGEKALPDPVILAVSKTSNPTGAWNRYLLRVGEPRVGNTFYANGNLTLGLDDRGLYFGLRIFPTTGPAFCKIIATRRAPLVDSPPKLGPVTQFSHLNGIVASPQPTTSYDPTPSAGPAWFVASIENAYANLRYWKLAWSGSTPVLSAAGTMATPAFGAPPLAPHKGEAVALDAGDERLQSAVLRGGHLWTVRTVGVNAGGTASSPTRTGCEWFDLNVTAATPTLAQMGRLYDPSATPRFYYFPTLAVNSQRHALLCCSGSSATEYVSAYFAGRLVSDPAGTLSAAHTLKAGEAPYGRTVGNGLIEIGRYGGLVLDPTDSASFWMVQPYAAATPTPDAWGTWIARVQLALVELPGAAKIRPVKLAFGKVKVKKAKSLSFTITSSGPNPLQGTVQTPAAPYSLTAGAGNFTLAAGRKLKVTVRFQPTAKGAVGGTVNVTTNDPKQPTVPVKLTGTGK